ncbi:MAG: DUF2085 domain-containing protein [Candidatus Altiarchaeota archaeon]
MNTDVAVYTAFLSVAAGICVLLVAAPYLTYSGHIFLGGYVYNSFSGLCHQLPERSFHLFGNKLAVCARDTGVYFGLLFSTLAYPLVRKLGDRSIPPRCWFIACILPLAVDGTTQLLGLRESNNTLRVATGLLFGMIIPFYLIPMFSEIADVFMGEFSKLRGG